MDITYFNFSQRAIQSEREEKYETAAIFWKKVSEHAKHSSNRKWAEYRSELNSKRHSLHERHQQWQADNKRRRKEDGETKRLAGAIKTHIDKENDSVSIKNTQQLIQKAKELEECGMFRRASEVYSEAIDRALTDKERERCTIDAKRCARKARLPHHCER
ncbi:ANR family transcriptional regulator [Photorhabdus sp. CRCIA-P01]|uniref:ANR family transcriptional regulator n=1 Tax=Photorhabdus sp. CRCIA-P01 TaxID=2019570 RepID=UPI000E59DF78|nr:ANR family transcriptional regulator [Photorhabdus sp. CRCIA-P01]